MLSDSELRRELIKLGESVGPITDTTRGLYARRLDKLRKENDIKLPVACVEIKKLTGKPVIMPARERSSSPVLRNSRRRYTLGYSTDESEEDAGHKGNTRTTRQSSRSFATSKEIETKSRTPVHKRVRALTNSRRSSSSPSSPGARSASVPKPAKYSDDSDDDVSESSSTGSWIDLQSTETNTTLSPASDRVKNNLSLRHSLNEFGSSRENSAFLDGEEKENINVPLQRRLLHGRRSTILRDVDQNDKTGNKVPVGNGIPAKSKNIVSSVDSSQRLLRNANQQESKPDSVKASSWTSNFSTILLIGLCIFFIVVGLLYATIKYDPSLNSGLQIDYEKAQSSSKEYLNIASMIYDRVGTYAGKKVCDNLEPQDEHITLHQLVEELQIKDATRNDSLKTALEKFTENPEWGIVLYDKSMRQIEGTINLKETMYLDTQQPILSGWCRLTRAVFKVLFRILLTIVAGFLVWLAIVYRRYRIEKQQVEREQIHAMVMKIIDVLRKQYDSSENNDAVQPFLPILHVRDMIIPPQDRKRMSRVWEKAKQFLSASETRIRVENQRILGEDYLVWRWIQATSPSKRHSPTSRVWQGEAFDVKTSINRPMICPTPCLKIRNLFDLDMEVSDNWIEQIQNSILEKCHSNNEILRICVEKDSKEGLVYMLCASNQAAGRAFQALHGAWFDGRLVTVKFIRLHRFHHRFPDSVNQSMVPMRPTSAVPVSTIMHSPSSSNDGPPYEKLYPSLSDD